MEASVTGSRAVVRSIRSARVLPLGADHELQTITAQLSLTGAALARLLSVSGMGESRFIISSPDGATAIQARLVVSTVPDGEQALGGQIVLNWSRGTLSHGDRRTTLSRMELRLLAVLIDAAPGALSKEALVARLWPDDTGNAARHERSLKVWICQLRRHFLAVGRPDAIDTVRGLGYRLSV